MRKRILVMFIIFCMILTMIPSVSLTAAAASPETASASAPGSFTVAFELNGGLGSADSQTVAGGGLISEPVGISKEGFTLDGWYKEADFATRWDFGTDTAVENMTLYANWIAENSPTIPGVALTPETPLPETASTGDSSAPGSFTVAFELNGGSGSADSQTVADGGLVSEPVGISKEGFTLGGWYKEADFVTRWDFGTDTVVENMMLYANWIAENSPTLRMLTAADVTTKEGLADALSVSGSGDVTLGGDITDITTQLTVERNVILDLNGHNLTITLNAEMGNNGNGITLASGVTLTIRDSSNPSTGKLTVTNNANNATSNNGAAINTTDSTLVIESGTVIAIGGTYGSGIGGGKSGTGGTVTINGGTVNAIGGDLGAGIGGGGFGAGGGGTVTINGGTVNATGGYLGAGIGGGGFGAGGGTLTITGGSVNANLSNSNAAVPKSADGSTQLYPAILMVKGSMGAVINTALADTGHTIKTGGSDYAYSTKGVKTDSSGYVYFWLPAATYDISLNAVGAVYSNNNVTVALDIGGAAQLTIRLTTKEDLASALSVSGSGDMTLGQDITDITTQLTVERDVTLDLNGHHLDIALDADTGNSSNGIKIASGVTLTIRDSSNPSTGKLTVTNNANNATSNNGAGINATGGTLVIESGTVIATGSLYAAGIGGGRSGDGGTVIISGGTVSATGGYLDGGTGPGFGSGAGIGGGYNGGRGTLTITGGSVRANPMSESNAAVPKGADGSTQLYMATLMVKGSIGAVTNTALAATGHTIKTGGSDYAYSTKGVKTDSSGNVYFWLPAATYDISLTAVGAVYSNNNVTVALGIGGAARLTTSQTTTEALAAALRLGSAGDITLGEDITDITTQLTVERDVTLDLNGHHLDIALDADAGNSANGIKIASGVTLTIRDSSNPSTGKLTVTNHANNVITSNNGAGINTTGGTLVIESGTVIATGGLRAAGIGGGYLGGGGTVTINGGTVNATGVYLGAGIGGGASGTGGTVTISGGSVIATGGDFGAGIGGGYLGGGGTVTINGGMVSATGVYLGPGIGGGNSGGRGTLTITGGSVNANNWDLACAAVPRASDGSTQLYPATLTVMGADTAVANTALAETGHTILTGSGVYAYGTRGVRTDADGKVHFWLPAATYDISLKVGSVNHAKTSVTVTAGSGVTAELTAVGLRTKEDLASALEAGGSGDVILAGNITDITTQLMVERDVTLDLNGHHLDIALGADAGNSSNGIKIASGVTLTIRDSGNPSTGKLTVTNNANNATTNNGAGINATGGTLVIESGTVIATGSLYAAGIGGGRSGDGGTVIISGGTVSATGGYLDGGTGPGFGSGAGIGGGYNGGRGTLTITGGSVRANPMSESNAAVPKGADGSTQLYMATLMLWGRVAVIANTTLADTGHTILTGSGVYAYGTRGVKTDSSGHVYFWLPAATYDISLTAVGAVYSNNNVTVALGIGGAARLTTSQTTTEALAAALRLGSAGDITLGEDITDITTQLTVERDVTLDLNGHHLDIALGADAGNSSNGIKIASGVTLTIRDSSNPSTGKLTVTNHANNVITSNNGAGINTTGGTLVIESGTVIATGGQRGAGIGGGYLGGGGTVTINGGTVNATGGDFSAGIGGGYLGDGGAVTINGGMVNANGGMGGAGIGGGNSGGRGTLTITGGSVQANNISYNSAAVPKASDGSTQLYPATLTVMGAGTAVANTALAETGHTIYTGSGVVCAYGTKGVKTDADGKVHFWLPAATYYIALNVDSVSYANYNVHVEAGSGGTAELTVIPTEEAKLRKAAADGGTYQLLADFDGQAGSEAILTVGLQIANDFTLDLNGRHLEIALDANTGRGSNGIKIASGVTLTIRDSSNPSTGKLTVKNGVDSYITYNNGAAINTTDGTLIIESGTVTTTGGLRAAGIGGGYAGNGGTVIINGGTVIANGGTNAPGIGGGYEGGRGTLAITGGSVRANNRDLISAAIAMNSDDSAQLYPATLTVMGTGAVANTALAATGHTIHTGSGSYAYGTKGVNTDADGKVYFWLPSATYAISLKVGSVSYANDAVPIEAGIGGGAMLTLITSSSPIGISLSGTSIAKSAALGTAIGTLSTTDLDGDTSFTYTLAAGAGSDDNNLFTIDGNTLKLDSSLDSVTGSSLSIRIRTTDASNNSYEEVFVITIINVPGAPIIGTAAAGDGQATVSFTAPTSNGGSAITAYTVTASPGGVTATGSSSPITVTGLTNGTAYTFTVTAANSIGAGAASAASNSITPNSCPSVVSVGVPASATYKAGDSLDFTVNFDEAVTVTGTPRLALTVGMDSVEATCVSGSGTSALVFRYTVVAGDTDTNGIEVGTLTLNGGTIKNTLGSDAMLTLNSVGSTTNVLVDTTAPTVASVNVPANGIYKAGNNLDFTVNFDERVSVTGTPKIALTVGLNTVEAAYMSGSGTSALTFRYTVAAGQLDTDGIAVGTLTLNGGSIKDSAGNPANLTLSSVGSTTGVRVDSVAPAAPTIALAPASDSGASSADGITNDNTPTFTGTAEEGSTIALYQGGTPIGTATADSFGNWSITITSSLSDGTYAMTAIATDPAGNVSSASTTLILVVDTQADIVSVSPADGAVNVAVNGRIAVTFDAAMDVTGLVKINGSALTGGTWNAGKTVYTVSYSNLTHNQSFTLDIIGFKDTAGNEVASQNITFTTTSDSAAPAVASLSPNGLDVPISTNRLAVTFDEAMDTATGTAALSGSAALASPQWSSDHKTVAYIMSDLSYGTTYMLALTGFRDTAGNEMAANTSFGFATEAAPAYTITASAGIGGSISPSGAVSVTQNGSQTFTITPDTNYSIASVTVDGIEKGAISAYTFSNVTAGHTITATFSTNYVEDQYIVDDGNNVTVDLTKGSSTLSAEQMNRLISLNQDHPIIMSGNGYTVTFPRGSMASDGSGDLDLGIQFNVGSYYATIKEQTGDDLVLMLDFNHSGALPGEAQIRIFVGNQYAAETLHYDYYNPQTGKLEFMQSVTVGSDGYVTVKQSHCSSYALTMYDADNVPETGDNSAPWIWWLLCSLSVAGVITLTLWRRQKKAC